MTEDLNEIDQPEIAPPIIPEPTPWDLVHRYLQDLWMIMTHPTAFFRAMPTEGGFSGPLTFALVTHWLGSAAAILWSALLGRWLAVYVNTFSRIAGDIATMNPSSSPSQWAQILSWKDRLWQWFWGTGSVITDPFFTLVSILFTSFFVFIGAKIFVSWIPSPTSQEKSPEVTFESALRLICYGMSPMILTAIPLFGWGLATFLSAIVTIIGAKEVYRVGIFRAIIIALFPKILFLTFILSGILIFLTIAIKLISSFF